MVRSKSPSLTLRVKQNLLKPKKKKLAKCQKQKIQICLWKYVESNHLSVSHIAYHISWHLLYIRITDIVIENWDFLPVCEIPVIWGANVSQKSFLWFLSNLIQ